MKWFTRRVRTVSPEWFRAHVRPALHESWDHCEAELLAEPLERRRIEELAAELTDSFERPIVIAFDHWWSRKPRVVDGVHRSIAAMRAGVDLRLRHGYPGTPEVAYDTYVVSAANVDAEVLLDATMSLSSFRCPSGLWAQSDGAMFLDGRVYLEYPQAPEELREEIASTLCQRLADAGLDATIAVERECQACAIG